MILAHRGDWSVAAENSLGAFAAAAVRPGVDGVEFDVRAAQDGTPVVVHDEDLLRVQGVAGLVGGMSVAELAAHGVPDFASVLEALPEPCFLDVELKEDVGAKAIGILARARGDRPRHTVISSFMPEAIATVRASAPAWPCWLISERLDEDVVRTATAIGCRGLAVEWPALRPETIVLAHDAGLELATWTPDDPATVRRLMSMGLVAICVDPPALPA